MSMDIKRRKKRGKREKWRKEHIGLRKK